MLSAVVLAAPDLKAAATGKNSFFFIVRAATHDATHAVIYVCIDAAQFLCGLAVVTSALALTWALAGRQWSPFQPPAAAYRQAQDAFGRNMVGLHGDHCDCVVRIL